MTLKLISPAFSSGQDIPKVYTCEGDDISPPLSWSGVPPGTKSFVLIVDDPDAPDPKAPKMTYVHWVLYDIAPDVRELAEGMTTPPKGARAGLNDWKRRAYGGPCPPVGRHRYFHKLYALDTGLGELNPATKGGLETAMKGHIIAEAVLIGTYQKAGQ